MLFADAWQAFRTYDFIQLLIWIIVVAAAIAIFIIALKKIFKVEIPDWVYQMLWILGVAAVAIIILRLLGGFL
jgi:hypothetical protein